MITLGVISDTHGQLDPCVLTYFQYVDVILHAGDIESVNVILELQALASVIAVRGNMDTYGKLARYPEWTVQQFEEICCMLTHQIGEPTTLRAPLQTIIQKHAPQLVIFGHTHIPYMQQHNQILWFNPGSASKPRGGSQRSIGRITIQQAEIHGEILPF